MVFHTIVENDFYLNFLFPSSFFPPLFPSTPIFPVFLKKKLLNQFDGISCVYFFKQKIITMTSSGGWSFMGFDFWKYDLYLFRSFYSKKNNKKIYTNHNKQCLHSFYNLLKECGIPFLFKKFPGEGGGRILQVGTENIFIEFISNKKKN